MMSMKVEKWWWPVQCYTLSNGLNFAGLLHLGNLLFVSVWCSWKYFGEWETLQQQYQQVLITSFHQGNHESSIIYLLLGFYVVNAKKCKHTYLSRKGRLWVVGIFCVSFHFFFVFFWWLLSSQDHGSLIRKKTFENGKKKSSIQGHFSHVVLFFLLPRFLILSRFGYSR